MTYKESYKWIYVHFAPCGDETELDDAITTALSAIAKQIPKKPHKDKDSVIEYTGRLRCPNCQTILGYYNDRTGYVDKQANIFYCSGCGQKLDWSKEEFKV